MDTTDHRMILIDKRLVLLENLNLLHTQVLDQLVQDHVISPVQLERMKATYKTNVDLASSLLDHLERRPFEDWKKFLRCLSDNHHGHLVNILQESKGMEPIPHDIHGIKCLMAERILGRYGKIRVWRWHEDHAGVPIDELYVDLVLMKDKNEVFGRGRQQLKNYAEPFKKSKSGSTIYIAGEPGVGKSTFASRLCVDWAKLNVEGEHIQQESERKFENFEIVLLVPLRDIKHGQSLRDVITEGFRIDQRDSETLCSFIERNQGSVLLILDGLDEYNESTSEEIANLLHKKWLPYVNLCVTSRYTAASFYENDQEMPDIELSLRGFSSEGVKEYLSRVFTGNTDERDDLLNKLEQSDELKRLSHYPAILLMMATLWHFTPCFANTLTTFYLEYIKYLCDRHQKKYRKGTEWKSAAHILNAYHDNLMEIGIIAVGGITSTKMELSFPYADVMRVIDSQTWELGILVEETSFLGGRRVVFPHKTLQEFFTSYFIVHSDEATQKKAISHFCGSLHAFKESSVIRRFFAGLGGEQLQKNIENLISGTEEVIPLMLTELKLDYLAEYQDANIELPSNMHLQITDKYSGSHYVRYLSQDGSNLKKLVWLGDERSICLLEHLNASNLESLELDGRLDTWCSVESEYTSQTLEMILPKFPLKVLTIINISDTNELPTVVQAAVKIKTIASLELFMSPLSGIPVKTITQWLPNSALEILSLGECYLALQEVVELVKVLPETLHYLDVSNNYLCGLRDKNKEIVGLASSNIQFLKMSKCFLTSRDVYVLLLVLPKDLIELDLSWNFVTEELAKLVNFIPGGKIGVKFETINLTRNEISEASSKSIEVALFKNKA